MTGSLQNIETEVVERKKGIAARSKVTGNCMGLSQTDHEDIFECMYARTCPVE